MSQRNNSLPWLIGGTILFVAVCGVCVVGMAAVSALFFDRPAADSIFARATSTPLALSATPVGQSERIPGPTSTPAPTLEPLILGDGGDVETQIYTQVYNRVNPSVVSVRVLDQDLMDGAADPDIRPFFFDSGEGSGFVLNADGYIVTNNHVVDNASSIVVQFYDGIRAPAEVIGTDSDTDLAVIKVDPAGLDLHPVSFGDIDDLQVGARVLVIGNPFGNANTLTTGIISALGRQIDLPDSQFRLPEVIQTDAAINPGNSGGPMLNADGEVIGVAFMLQSTSRTNSGIGFGIPVYFIRRVADAIIADGEYRHPWIGIRGNTLSPFEIRELGLDVDHGVLVAEAIPGSPAAKAGLRGGDENITLEGAQFVVGGDIITAIDGHPVKVFEDLLAYLGRYTDPGSEITLTVVRNGETLDLVVVLEPRPDSLAP
ncbi:MAG: trypsin-like peptidase domain-containing protein [Caldilineales bacterium]|nr:trypsin-like peptidase domain-containing protein [Caldilineales bacterium]